MVKRTAIQLLCLWGCDIISNTTGTGFREQTLKDGTTRRYNLRFGKKGSGDVLACSPHGRWIEVETKAQDGVLSPEQAERKIRMEGMGAVYVVMRRPEDLEARKSDILARPHWTA